MQSTLVNNPSTKLAEYAQYLCAQRDYKFKSFLGAGAFKECFAIDAPDGTKYALKVLKPGCSRARLDREIQAMKQCDHVHIAKLFEVSTANVNGVAVDFMIEEMLEGGTLQSYLTNHGLLSANACKQLAERLISALSHIAKQRIVHRDIKPANVMFRQDISSPVLVDFGLVRSLGDDSLTQTWLVRGPGTPIFAPPEQLNNEKELIDWRSDQFSLGLLLYVSMFGEHPFKNGASRDHEIVERVAMRDPLSPTAIANITDANFLPLLKMLSPWPVQRYRTAADLQESWTNL